VLRRGLSGTLDRPRPATAPIPEFLVFRRKAATFPWISHAAWLFSQMVRWGQIAGGSDAAERARRCYRPDIYRAALKGVDTAMPGANAKVEGALAQETPVGSSNGRLVLGPDGFFDGVPFDPDRLAPYIDSFGIRTEPGAEAADAGDAA
jgi:NitT/TauT family transport system ATP-binding protein